ncbi:MAG TPA: hypothetical protein VNA22_04020 [Pyrinomonadaceae bacterium]|nr:hypothetical protein [Pyrinomonadaceae bacterium]
MNPFAGKSSTERNKMIAAIVLGVLALGALFFAFGGPAMFSSGTKLTVSVSPTPKPSATVPINPADLKLPSQTEQYFTYQSTPVDYRGVVTGPDPGRNIFAFYEPPEPTPYVPTPLPTPKPATPTPTPEIWLASVNPASVYAGSRGFRIELSGERMLPEARVYMSQSELKTTFVNDRSMVAEVPANFITSEGPRQIIIQTLDGKKYSQAVSLVVQAPPRPQFQYIGMIARRRGNNDTAYFMEQGRQTPLSARLSDVVGGRFRLVSISSEETVFEDVNLGFKHKVPLFRPAPGTTSSTLPPPRPGDNNIYVPFNTNSNFQVQPGQSIPGIPDNIPRYVPPAANRPPPPPSKDDDEDGDGKP